MSGVAKGAPAALLTGLELDPEICANPMTAVSTYSGGGWDTSTVKIASHLCGYFLKVQLQT